MNDTVIIDIGREAFITILKVGGPILFVGLIIGLVVSIFQTITSIQEQTLTFIPKIFGIFTALLLMLPFMIHQILALGNSMFDRLIALGFS